MQAEIASLHSSVSKLAAMHNGRHPVINDEK